MENYWTIRCRKRRNEKSLSAFGDKFACPTDFDLHRALGPSASLWDDLVTHVSRTYAPAVEHWSFSGPKFGWSLRLKQGDRIVLYLIPQVGRFLVGIVLGAKAVAAAQRENLPDAVLKAIAEAPRYAEGTGLRLPVTNGDELASIKKLAALKMARP